MTGHGHRKIEIPVGRQILEIYPKIFMLETQISPEILADRKVTLKYVWRGKQMIDACLTPSSFSFCCCDDDDDGMKGKAGVNNKSRGKAKIGKD